jgi:hypothetical protein
LNPGVTSGGLENPFSFLFLAPVLLTLAWAGAARVFVALLCVSLLTDMVDGKLARRRIKFTGGAAATSTGEASTVYRRNRLYAGRDKDRHYDFQSPKVT